MLTDQFTQTLDTYGTAQDERAQARQSAGAAFDQLFGQARLAGWWVKLTGRPTALAATEYLLLSKRTRQVLETDAGTAWKPSNRPA